MRCYFETNPIHSLHYVAYRLVYYKHAVIKVDPSSTVGCFILFKRAVIEVLDVRPSLCTRERVHVLYLIIQRQQASRIRYLLDLFGFFGVLYFRPITQRIKFVWEDIKHATFKHYHALGFSGLGGGGADRYLIIETLWYGTGDFLSLYQPSFSSMHWTRIKYI